MVLSFTGVMKMKMNLSKRILVALLSCLLVQFTAQAGSYTSASQSGQQPQGPAAGQTARAAATCRSDRLVPRRTRCADSRRLHLSNRDCRGGPLDAKSFEPQG